MVPYTPPNFENSWNMATDWGGYIYCEGLAAQNDCDWMVYDHAWCIDTKGNVYDPTWTYENHEVVYYGIPFNDEYITDGQCDMFNHYRTFNCLKLDPSEYLHYTYKGPYKGQIKWCH